MSNKIFFPLIFLVSIPLTTLAQPCEFEGGRAFCEKQSVQLLRQPSHYIFNSQVFVNSDHKKLDVYIYIDVGTKRGWNFDDLKYAYARVDGTTYRLRAERTKTALKSGQYLERVRVSLIMNEYVRDAANATSFSISVGGARFNFDPVLNDIRSILKYHEEQP